MNTMENTSYWGYRAVIMICVAVCISLSFGKSSTHHPAPFGSTPAVSAATAEKMFLYEKLQLKALGLSREAFNYALTGFTNLMNIGKIRKENILSILDFSLPSCKKRLFVIDLELGELVFTTYASHGKNSGKVVPTSFSNQTNSNKSSLGFYVTGETYTGKHGCSLRLEGEEKGINNNALARGIVMHSAEYVSESVAAKQGFIGRSQGCPALPQNIAKPIIDKIKNGSCLFIYSPDTYYTSHSRMIRNNA